MFIDIVMFGRTAEIANQYLRKGSKVLIDGRLTLQQWTAQDGTKRSKHVVTVETLKMLDYKQDGENQQNQGYQQQQQGGYSQPPQQQQTQNDVDIDDDEIPF
jgi:single-strand DNA-binding protein